MFSSVAHKLLINQFLLFWKHLLEFLVSVPKVPLLCPQWLSFFGSMDFRLKPLLVSFQLFILCLQAWHTFRWTNLELGMLKLRCSIYVSYRCTMYSILFFQDKRKISSFCQKKFGTNFSLQVNDKQPACHDAFLSWVSDALSVRVFLERVFSTCSS